MTEAPKDQEVPAEDLSDDELEDVGGGGVGFVGGLAPTANARGVVGNGAAG